MDPTRPIAKSMDALAQSNHSTDGISMKAGLSASLCYFTQSTQRETNQLQGFFKAGCSVNRTSRPVGEIWIHSQTTLAEDPALANRQRQVTNEPESEATRAVRSATARRRPPGQRSQRCCPENPSDWRSLAGSDSEDEPSRLGLRFPTGVR